MNVESLHSIDKQREFKMKINAVRFESIKSIFLLLFNAVYPYNEIYALSLEIYKTLYKFR